MARKDPNSDGVTPDCRNCVRLQLRCEQPTVDHRFLIHTNKPIHSSTGTPPTPSRQKQSPGIFGESGESEESGGAADIRLRQAAELSRQSPRVALENTVIAQIFSHYIEAIAPWYDLNDAANTFGVVVTVHALDFPVLFRAIIALAGSHWFKMKRHSQEISFAFYATCVEDLLRALDESSKFPAEYLAAACILQLYEILNSKCFFSFSFEPQSPTLITILVSCPNITVSEESVQDPPCHLSGAYSFSTAIHIDFSTWDIAQAGFWNYLREEITIALASTSNRVVRIGKDLPQLRDMMSRSIGDDMRANLVTYILARALNLYCAFRAANVDGGDHQWTYEHTAAWNELMEDLTQWTEALPPTFQPFSTSPKLGNAFPSEWMLKPWHVCALQYASLSKILLALSSPNQRSENNSGTLDMVKNLTIQVCGIAYTNENVPAMINSFGPLLFCGRYLTLRTHREVLEKMLIRFAQPTGYPIEYNIKQLKEWWTQSDNRG